MSLEYNWGYINKFDNLNIDTLFTNYHELGLPKCDYVTKLLQRISIYAVTKHKRSTTPTQSLV